MPSIIDKPKVTLVETIGRCPLCQSLAFRTRDCGMGLITGCYQVCFYSRGVLKIAYINDEIVMIQAGAVKILLVY